MKMNKYYYVYVFQSEKDKDFYTGFTKDIRKRMKDHESGKVSSTRNRLPLKPMYWEGCLHQSDATTREKYLKSSWGKRYLKNRLKNYLTG
jgi:putative endonuclease